MHKPKNMTKVGARTEYFSRYYSVFKRRQFVSVVLYIFKNTYMIRYFCLSKRNAVSLRFKILRQMPLLCGTSLYLALDLEFPYISNKSAKTLARIICFYLPNDTE